MKSKLKVYNSQFTHNTAKKGGSIAVFVSDSFIESCNLTSDTASLDGGCISLNAANMTVKHSHFSACRSEDARSISITQSILRLEAVTISDSHGTEFRSALHVSVKSDLLVKDSVLTGYRSPDAGPITCSDSSRVYLDTVLISNYSSDSWSGCVDSSRCNLTIDNITFTHTDRAIKAYKSTVNIYNTVTLNDMELFLDASNSHVTFWAFTMRGTYIRLLDSVAEFRHTLFTRQDKTCLMKAWNKNTIKLKSVYVTSPTDGLVCGWNGRVASKYTVVQGHVSGRTYFFFFTTIKK